MFHFTPKQGQYLAFIYHYTKVNRRPPAQTDIQRFFGVTPPSVHQMILKLEEKGLLRRNPHQARSIEVLVPAQQLPSLGGVEKTKTGLRQDDELQLQMVWPEQLLSTLPRVQLPDGYTIRTYQTGDEARFYEVMALAGWPGWNDEKLQPWLSRILPNGWFMIIEEASEEIVATAMCLHNYKETNPFQGLNDALMWYGSRTETNADVSILYFCPCFLPSTSRRLGSDSAAYGSNSIDLNIHYFYSGGSNAFILADGPLCPVADVGAGG